MSSPSGQTLLEHFAALKDPRQAWKVVYPLPEVMLLTLSATIAGAEDCVEIRRWGKLHLDFLRRFLPFAKGIPSHDTLNDIPTRSMPRSSSNSHFAGPVEFCVLECGER
jgi:hypothetical protein